MGRKMWWPGVALPVFLLLLSASVNSGPVISGDGLLIREPESDLLSAPALDPTATGPSLPDLGELAPSYNCSQNGSFAKDGSCRDYYQCEETSEPGILTAYLFTCQPGMVFDDNLGTCDLASQVTTRPDCTTEGTILTNVSEQNKEFQCNQKTVKEMSKGTDEICKNVNHVENYVDLVMRLIPLRKYHKNNLKVTEFLKLYDEDLEAAQNHAKIWRDGDSILIGIAQTVKLAKNFEPEFQRKYKINKERVETIKKHADEKILADEISNEIAKLEKRLHDLNHTIYRLPKESRIYMEPMKRDLEEELVEKGLELAKNTILPRELKELIIFLESVRKDASEIRRVANKTRARVDVFKNNLGQDKSKFERHMNVSRLTLEEENNKAVKNNEKLAKIQDDKRELESKVKEQRQIVKKLFQDIDVINGNVYNMRREIMTKEPSKKRMFFASAVEGMIKAVASIIIPNRGAVASDGGAAARASDAAARASKAESEKLRLEIAKMNLAIKEAEVKQGRIKTIMDRIQHENGLIAEFQDQLIRDLESSKDIQSQWHEYVILKLDLERMQSQLELLIPAIEKAIYGIDGIKCVFDSVIGKLDEMIRHAKEAKTESEQENAHFYVFQEISVLEENWNGAYDLLLNLDTCTGLLI